MDCMRNQFEEGLLLDGRYETISPLNHGSFGMVFLANDTFTGEVVAIKCLTKTASANPCPSAISIDERSEELAIHRKIGTHPNIVNLLETFETEHHTYLVLEFCPNGDLYEAIRLGKGPLETEHVREFMLELVDAVQFLHSKGLYHRDIKPENIFLTSTGSLKLGDFGLATMDCWSFEASVGSDRYMAPEQYDPAGSGYSPAQADVWAIGICLLNILFSRNPFAIPTEEDPLYADYVRDHQSLFDVFPNMSQDTFEVLMQCLQLDPSRRSLSGLKEAIERAVSFTTDDESLDDFCTDDRDVVPATINREPLRTPSIKSPQIDNGASFPWAKALQMSPQQPVRQLSVIPDTEIYADDLFPGADVSDRDWYKVKPDNVSIASVVDSGLGVSFKSIEIPKTRAAAQPTSVAASLPVTASRPVPAMASVFSKSRDFLSKSWSDLWDEEEQENSELEHDNSSKETLESTASRTWSNGSAGSGHETPRAALAEVKNDSPAKSRKNSSAFSRWRKNTVTQNHVSENTGFIFDDHHPPTTARYSPNAKRSILDKWSALGDRRRGKQDSKNEASDPEKTPVATPVKAPAKSMRKTPSGKTPAPDKKQRLRAKSWRSNVPFSSTQHSNDIGAWERKQDWSSSKDWRRHDIPPVPQHTLYGPLSKHVSSQHQAPDDIGDLEWVGGWNDLHL